MKKVLPVNHKKIIVFLRHYALVEFKFSQKENQSN
jgi:hypothetical protein